MSASSRYEGYLFKIFYHLPDTFHGILIRSPKVAKVPLIWRKIVIFNVWTPERIRDIVINVTKWNQVEWAWALIIYFIVGINKYFPTKKRQKKTLWVVVPNQYLFLLKIMMIIKFEKKSGIMKRNAYPLSWYIYFVSCGPLRVPGYV